MKPSFANADNTASTDLQDSFVSQKQIKVMKNSRLSLSDKQLKWEVSFKKLLIIMSAVLLLIVLGVLITLIVESLPSIKSLGIGYLWGKVWDPVNNVYGAYPFLIGTLLTSFIALIISIPFSYAIAIYLGEYN
ncbi:MAG: hypothetical protein JO080_01480, partial [Mucilaginibacter sp.]|nr:hypothetical protein [Mucilaginibacter sp.]